MVATNAFGLGVNIPNVRLVIHHSPSVGLDEYVQEAGRAGRNGKQAEAVLLWHPYDFTINQGLLEKAKMDLTGRERKDRLDALEALKRYAQDKGRCRWRIIRKFFGEKKGIGVKISVTTAIMPKTRSEGFELSEKRVCV